MAMRSRRDHPEETSHRGTVAKVVEDPLFVLQTTGVVPRAPVLTAAPKDRNRQHAASLDEQGVGLVEVGRDGDVETAIANEQDGDVAGPSHVAPTGQEQGDRHSIVRRHKDLLAHHVVGVDRSSRRPEQLRLAAFDVVRPKRARSL